MSRARPVQALVGVLAVASLAGCTYRYQGEPVPQAPLSLPAKAPIAATAEIHYRYDGDPWRGPFAWDQVVREELEHSKLLGVAGLGRALRIDVSREIETPVWRYVVHLLTAFLFPRSAELSLTVRATLLGPQDVELAAREVRSTIEAQASLLFLFFPPAWASWSTAGSGNEHPLVLENVRELARVALAALAQDVAPRGPKLEPLPADPPAAAGPPAAAELPAATDPPPAPRAHAYCTECGEALQPTWKHCPGCGTPTRAGD
ncbi:MAG: zinc ribbon domain-containing protein [Planctomycetes bacterium]|nr:zinc ribbon domain-containing protein [Planctomycetota bacterium]